MAILKGMKSSPPFFLKWGGNMGKNFILARSNLHKTKGQIVAIVVLLLLAASMLNLWLMLSMDYRQNFERCHDRLNAEHVTITVDGNQTEIKEFLAQTLENDNRTAEFSLNDSMHMVGLFENNGGDVNEEMIFLAKQTAISRPVGRVEIIENSGIKSGIYMPILYKSDDIAIGKTIEISIGSNKVSYTVCGFFNSVMAGSHNCAMCEFILTEDKYEELKETGYAPQSTLCSVRLKDKTECEDYEAMLKNAVSSRYPSARAISNSYALVAQSRYISQMICSGIISAMAFLILLIALVVISSNIINYIQENMKNLGTLKAVGFTSRQLICSLLLQFLGLSLIVTVIGIGLSYSLFPFLNTMMASQTGIPYTVHFLPLPLAFTLWISCGTVALVVWLSSRRIKNVEPIIALRQGVRTHNFKRNHVPLEKTRASLNLALALKTTLSGIKHNITVCITMLVLSLVIVFSGVMTENVIVDMTPFLNLIMGEVSDSCINVNAEIEHAFLQEMNADKRVKKVYLYHSIEVRHVGGVGLTAIICDDFSKATNQNIVFEGRFPKFDNEIAVAAKYARERDLKIGDEITITANGKEAAYLISGFTQISNNLGKDCLLTRSGYERLGELQNTSYYLILADDIDIDAFNSEAKERFGNDINAVINVDSMIEGAASVYVSLMTIIVIAILILSAIVIAFVLYLLVRTMIGNKKRDYGILKALGFTTGQLILQTALSFMPATIFSTIAGIAVSCLIINPLTALFLNSIGIVKCTFTVPVGFITVAATWLILFAFAIVCLLSLKIRKIAPRALLAGE